MRNLIIIKTSSKKLLKTRNSFENCKIGRYRGKARHWEARQGKSLPGKFGRMEHICQLTNQIAYSQLLKPFIEPILMTVLTWIIVVQFS